MRLFEKFLTVFGYRQNPVSISEDIPEDTKAKNLKVIDLDGTVMCDKCGTTIPIALLSLSSNEWERYVGSKCQMAYCYGRIKAHCTRCGNWLIFLPKDGSCLVHQYSYDD